MGKTKILFIILIGIFLVGCSKNDVIEEEPLVDSSQEIGQPFDISVHDGDQTNNLKLDSFCWAEEEEDKTCSIEPRPPHELLQGATHLSVEKGANISLSLRTSDPSWLYLLSPEKIDLVQIHKGEKSTFEVTSKQFFAPKEKGVYYYSAILTWDGDQKGEAIYAFSLSVR